MQAGKQNNGLMNRATDGSFLKGKITMAYFSNGTEGEALDNECSDCILGDLRVGVCPVFYAQIEYNYEACNNPLARKILNRLVKQNEDYEYIGCQLKSLLPKLKDKQRTIAALEIMVKDFQWRKQQTGLDAEDSPELKEAKDLLAELKNE